MSRKFNVPEVAVAVKDLEDLGFTEVSSKGHPRFEHPEHGAIGLALTPSHPEQWLKNFRARLAQKLGMNKGELEHQLGLRDVKRAGPKRPKRKRNEAGRRARAFALVRDEKPQPERVGTVKERMEDIAREIAICDGRMNLAMPGETYNELLAERTRLRGEYMQLEADQKVKA